MAGVAATEPTVRRKAVFAGPTRSDRAFEMKFILPETLVAPVTAWARENLSPDPLARAADGDTYRIHSLYFDTDRFDVYHRTPGYRASKYRVRRYGSEPLLYLEKKMKRAGWVRKQRTAVPLQDLPRLLDEADTGPWEGDWFRDRVSRLGLEPSCMVSYVRVARVGQADGAPIRLTLDREIRCLPASGLSLDAFDAEPGHLVERYILELKFRTALPQLYKQLIREFGLSPHGSSKYRLATELTKLGQPVAIEGDCMVSSRLLAAAER